MKQHISINQLNELSEKGKERLKGWWKPNIGDMLMFANGVSGPITSHNFDNKEDGISFMVGQGTDIPDEFLKSDCYPLLSIGQMIEFLDEHNRGHEGVNILPLINKFDTESNYIDVKPVNKWCDALWEATKKILEQEEK